jgi:hypothetical protein
MRGDRNGNGVVIGHGNQGGRVGGHPFDAATGGGTQLWRLPLASAGGVPQQIWQYFT